MMTRLIEILIALAIVTVLFLLVGLALPSHRHLTKEIETNRKMTIVYDTLNSPTRFKDWNPLVLRDPGMALKQSGPKSGVGARLDYDSDKPQLGQGSWEITESQPGQGVAYAVTNPERGSNKRMTFRLEPTGRGGRNVKITQVYDVDYGWNLLGRYAGLYVGRHVGDDMKLGLERLSNMLTSVPNVDYSAQGTGISNIGVADVPATNLLVVSAGSIERDDDKLQESMRSNMEWINRNLSANGLVAAGPIRIITDEMGRENYTFDVALPVRKAGAASAKPANSESETAESPAPVADTASAEPLTGLKLTGPVKYVQVPAGRAVVADYDGYWAGLETVHNALRAWALTQGHEPVDRPYDSYTKGIDAAFTEDGKFQAYWGLKQ